MIGGLGSLYEGLGALHWPLIRATAGIILFTHGWPKLMMGFQAVAANTLAGRGIEPALPLAYALVLLETAGAICILLGFLTRPIAIMLVVEFAVIVYQHFPNGYLLDRARLRISAAVGSAVPRHRDPRGRTLLSRSVDWSRSLIRQKPYVSRPSELSERRAGTPTGR